MNVKEFAALKPGDKIVNPMNGSHGVVSRISDSGVHLQWVGSKMEFFFSVVGTAWTHWSMDEDTLDQALLDELHSPPKSIMREEPKS